MVAKRSPWEASRSAWLIGCGELLGGITAATRATTRPDEQVQQQGDPSDQPSERSERRALDQPLEAHPNEGPEVIADEPDHTEGQEQEDTEVTAWYEEVGNVLWCQFTLEDEHDAEGQPLVEYEDLLSGDVLDLTQRKEPEHYWYW